MLWRSQFTSCIHNLCLILAFVSSRVRSFNFYASIISFSSIKSSFFTWGQVMVILRLHDMWAGLACNLAYVGLVFGDEVFLKKKLLIISQVSFSLQFNSIKRWMTEASWGCSMNLMVSRRGWLLAYSSSMHIFVPIKLWIEMGYIHEVIVREVILSMHRHIGNSDLEILHVWDHYDITLHRLIQTLELFVLSFLFPFFSSSFGCESFLTLDFLISSIGVFLFTLTTLAHIRLINTAAKVTLLLGTFGLKWGKLWIIELFVDLGCVMMLLRFDIALLAQSLLEIEVCAPICICMLIVIILVIHELMIARDCIAMVAIALLGTFSAIIGLRGISSGICVDVWLLTWQETGCSFGCSVDLTGSSHGLKPNGYRLAPYIAVRGILNRRVVIIKCLAIVESMITVVILIDVLLASHRVGII